MGAILSTSQPQHTCGQQADESQYIYPLLCQRCEENANIMFEREAAVRTKAYLYPNQYKLETYNLSEDPNWTDRLLRPSPEVTAMREQAVRDLVRVYCSGATFPGKKKTCTCNPTYIEMKKIEDRLATQILSMPACHLSFEPVRTLAPEGQEIEMMERNVPKGMFAIGEDEEEGDVEDEYPSGEAADGVIPNQHSGTGSVLSEQSKVSSLEPEVGLAELEAPSPPKVY